MASLIKRIERLIKQFILQQLAARGYGLVLLDSAGNKGRTSANPVSGGDLSQMTAVRREIAELKALVRTVGSRSGDICELAWRLDEAARRHLIASPGGTSADDGHARIAEYYGRLATLVSQYWVGQGQLPTDAYPDDDLTLQYAIQAKVYDTEAEAEVDASQPFLPWRNLWTDPDCAVLLALGGHNAGNHGEVPYTCHRNVYSLDPWRMRCARAADPLAGASGTRGSIWSRLGDLLIERGVYRRVLFVSLAIEDSFIADWLPGGRRHGRLALALSRLRKAMGVTALPFSAVLWQQGEAEANHTEMSAKAYKLHFQDLVSDLRANGVFAPVFVARSTLCQYPSGSGRNRDAIREAQHDLPDISVGIFAGPDTDEVGLDQRFDRCRLSGPGLQRCAELWLDAIAHHRPLLDKLLPAQDALEPFPGGTLLKGTRAAPAKI